MWEGVGFSDLFNGEEIQEATILMGIVRSPWSHARIRAKPGRTIKATIERIVMSIDQPPITPQQYEVLHGSGAEAAEISQ